MFQKYTNMYVLICVCVYVEICVEKKTERKINIAGDYIFMLCMWNESSFFSVFCKYILA